MSKEIKEAARQVAKAGSDKPVKANRTLSLDNHNFELLAKHCKKEGTKISNVIDDLIAAYLEAIR